MRRRQATAAPLAGSLARAPGPTTDPSQRGAPPGQTAPHAENRQQSAQPGSTSGRAEAAMTRRGRGFSSWTGPALLRLFELYDVKPRQRAAADLHETSG